MNIWYEMDVKRLNWFDYCLDEEKELVEEVFNNAIDVLSDEDKKLPQVCRLRD